MDLEPHCYVEEKLRGQLLGFRTMDDNMTITLFFAVEDQP